MSKLIDYVKKYGSANKLTAIPLAIAGWLRYLLAIDDKGNPFTLSSDPILEELTSKLKNIRVGDLTSYHGELKDILTNESIFGIDLYQAGIGDKIEKMFIEEIAGCGAITTTLTKYLKKWQKIN